VTETTGSTATPDNGNQDGAVDVSDATPAAGQEDSTLSRRERKRARKAEGGGPSGKRAKKGLVARIGLFYRQIIAELRKVVWPTRNELTSYTSVVIVFVLVIMALVYGLDTGFVKLASIVFG
jgi:preprotein translocase subunit SecE